ncbi:alpha-L-rhamnosidase C-terminal domain-containing protein [Cohnella sp. GCM10020058]|uniref:alpha-L-rhamnosidase-related protein n=1 Tax=Cohnella sp. GCM10020058 TaxID=3317330 RepID=UPI00362B57A5
MSVKEKSAAWIWYPGDFEIWLRREVELRRDERLVATPPIWRVDAPYAVVRFRKEIELERAERAVFAADGSLRLTVDGRIAAVDAGDLTVALPAGKHLIVAEVANTVAFPSLYVSGNGIRSDGGWTVSHRMAAGYVEAGCGEFTDFRKPPSRFRLATEAAAPAWIRQEGRTLFADFGKETFGYVRLHGLEGEGTIRLQYGESEEEARDEAFGETIDIVAVLGGGAEPLTAGRSRAFRYVCAIPEGDVRIGTVDMLYEYSPVTYRGSFECDDARLNDIYRTSLYTFHLNTRELFLDGIKRDRWVWSGDAYQSYLMNYYSFFDLETTRRTIVALRGKDPVEEHMNTILDYSLYWFLGLEDYYRYTGDLGFVRRNYEKMKSYMAFVISRANDNGMLEGQPDDWVFVDWADMEKEGELAFEQLLFCLSLETMARFASLFDDGEAAAGYAARAERLRRDLRDVFWDEARGAFVHRRANGEIDPLVTKHPTMFAVLYGLLDPTARTRVKETVLANPRVPGIKTPYMRFYELAALCELDELDAVRREMLRYWGGMLDLGATTFWEEYDPDVGVPAQYAMYDRPYGKSLCHAWGASPIYLLGKYYLGVTPEAPGYARVRIKPGLGGLAWIKGSVPTPAGEVQVYRDAEKIRVSIPAGTGVVCFSSPRRPSVGRGALRATGVDTFELELDEPGVEYEVVF